jgi:hypothetical protein
MLPAIGLFETHDSKGGGVTFPFSAVSVVVGEFKSVPNLNRNSSFEPKRPQGTAPVAASRVLSGWV